MKKKYLSIFILLISIVFASCNMAAVKATNVSNGENQGEKNSPKQSIKIIEKAINEKKEEIEVDVKIPVIDGMENKEVQSKINQMFENDIMKFKDEIEKEAKEAYEDAKKAKYEFRTYSVNTTYKVTYEKDDVLSIVVTYADYTGGAHGMHNNVAYNIDLKTGNKIELKDLFKENADYKKVINEEIKKQIAKDPDKYFHEVGFGFETINDNQQFYFEDENIVVYFGLYEIAPYASGIPEFKIPCSQLKDILRG